jgi:hypothetical protein
MAIKVAEYAAMRGVSPQAVRKAINSGRLRRSVVRDGRSYMIDVDIADAEWGRNTASEQVRTAEQINAGKAAAQDRVADTPSLKGAPSYAQARAYGEGFKAKLLELEFRERAGQLTRKDDVTNATFKTFRLVRDAVQNIPIRVVNELAAIVGDVEPEKRHEMMLVMQREINRALEQFADGNGPR